MVISFRADEHGGEILAQLRAIYNRLTRAHHAESL
jgi:hypothetical protein